MVRSAALGRWGTFSVNKTELGSPNHQVNKSWRISVSSESRSRLWWELDGISSSLRSGWGGEAVENQIQEQEELQLGFAQ